MTCEDPWIPSSRYFLSPEASGWRFLWLICCMLFIVKLGKGYAQGVDISSKSPLNTAWAAKPVCPRGFLDQTQTKVLFGTPTEHERTSVWLNLMWAIVLFGFQDWSHLDACHCSSGDHANLHARVHREVVRRPFSTGVQTRNTRRCQWPTNYSLDPIAMAILGSKTNVPYLKRQIYHDCTS